MNNIRNIEQLTAQELSHGIFGGVTKGSWHEKYAESAWVYLGGFSFELTEGDLICVMSQWGEVEDIHLVREKETGKSKGFAFIKYEDQRSTILAVDNFNGIKLLGRVLRCDHVENYKLPKEVREKEEELLQENPGSDVFIGPGHAYKNKELASEYDITKGVDLWRKVQSSQPSSASVAHLNSSKSSEVVRDYNDHVVKVDPKHLLASENRKDREKRERDVSDGESTSRVENSRGKAKGRHSSRSRSRSRNRENFRGGKRYKYDSRSPSDSSRTDRKHSFRKRDSHSRDRYSQRRSRDKRGHKDDSSSQSSRDSRGRDRYYYRGDSRDRQKRNSEEEKKRPREHVTSAHDKILARPNDKAVSLSAEGGAVASWRGRRDPTPSAAQSVLNKQSSSSEPVKKRDEFSGFGGYNRTR